MRLLQIRQARPSSDEFLYFLDASIVEEKFIGNTARDNRFALDLSESELFEHFVTLGPGGNGAKTLDEVAI